MPGGQLAPLVEGEDGVVERAVVQFGHAAGDEEEVVSAGRLAERPGPRPVRVSASAPRVVGQGLGVVAARPQLGEHEELHTLGRGSVDHAKGDR